MLRCDACGATFEKPLEKLLFRESWGYHGGSPAEYLYACPECHCEDFGEVEEEEE